MIKRNNQGIGHILMALVVIVVVGVIAYVGYTVTKKDKLTTTTTASASTKTAAKETVWTDGGTAVSGTYADADVVKTSDTTYRMYYATQPEVKGNKLEIYSATSTDGITWTQESGTRKTLATFPDVVKASDGKYRMYYQGAGVIKSAISTDGLTFTDEAGTRIDIVNSDGLTFDNVAAPTTLLKDDGTYVMVYRGTINSKYQSDTPNQSTQLLMWATSSDGLIFTKKGIAVDSRNSTLRGQLDGPDLVKWDDSSIKMFVTNYNGVYQYAFDGSKFSGQTLAFTLSKTTDSNGYGIPPGDPALAKINGYWYMYYGATGANTGIHYAVLK